MTVYRIIELRHGAGRGGEIQTEWVIEKRVGILFKRWKEIMLSENGKQKRISHPSYKDADKYLMDNYTSGSGIGSMVTRSKNLYYVEPYSLNYC